MNRVDAQQSIVNETKKGYGHAQLKPKQGCFCCDLCGCYERVKSCVKGMFLRACLKGTWVSGMKLFLTRITFFN